MKKPFTESGKKYLDNLTAWFQDTRLMSEAIFRLYGNFQKDGTIRFDEKSWPKGNKQKLTLSNFSITPVVLSQRMDGLLKNLWATRFVFLESLWEEYLQELVQELRHQDASIFEPFCERDYMAEVIRNVLTGNITSIDDVKDEIATRFATRITRGSWNDQWKQLRRLQIGLSDKDVSEAWYNKLAAYFEMRNCIIHLRGRISQTLHKVEPYYEKKDRLEVWPPQLDFYRHQFIDCLMHIESKIETNHKVNKNAKES